MAPPPIDLVLLIGLPLGIGIGALLVLCGLAFAAYAYRRRLAELLFDKAGRMLTEVVAAPAGDPLAEMQAPAPASVADDSSRHQNEDERRRLRERIAGLTAEDRTLQARRAANEGIESAEMAKAAEASVASMGSPEAALLSAVSRSVSAGEVYALLRRGANPDAAFLDRGALAVAARKGALGVVKVLIDAGATLDQKDGRGWTPLMHAIDAHSASNSREAVLALLLDSGAAVDVWGNDLTGPLDLLEARESRIQAEQASLQQQASFATAGVPPPVLCGYGASLAAVHALSSAEAQEQEHGGGYDPSPPRDLAVLIRQKSGRDFENEAFGSGGKLKSPKTSPELLAVE